MIENKNAELKLLRIQSGIKAKDIAKRLNKSPAWVTKVERGEIAISDDLYNLIKSYYSTDIEFQNKNKRYEEKIQFLLTENAKLKELLYLYMPYDESDVEKILTRVGYR